MALYPACYRAGRGFRRRHSWRASSNWTERADTVGFPSPPNRGGQTGPAISRPAVLGALRGERSCHRPGIPKALEQSKLDDYRASRYPRPLVRVERESDEFLVLFVVY